MSGNPSSGANWNSEREHLSCLCVGAFLGRFVGVVRFCCVVAVEGPGGLYAKCAEDNQPTGPATFKSLTDRTAAIRTKTKPLRCPNGTWLLNISPKPLLVLHRIPDRIKATNAVIVTNAGSMALVIASRSELIIWLRPGYDQWFGHQFAVLWRPIG